MLKPIKKTIINKYFKAVNLNLARMAKGQIPAEAISRERAQRWLRAVVRAFKNDPEDRQAKDYKIVREGNFYMFNYISELNRQGKLKAYDSYPLIFVVEKYGSQGFLGLNFHWIHPRFRAYVLYKLIQAFPQKFANDDYLRPMNFHILERILGPQGRRYIRMAIHRYSTEGIQNVHGLWVFRIKNVAMTDAVVFSSPKLTGIDTPTYLREMLKSAQKPSRK